MPDAMMSTQSPGRTGALRERVTEMLRKEPRLRAFRLGAWNEGGAGVTVVDL
jgi:DNA mismatch repair protein MutS2